MAGTPPDPITAERLSELIGLIYDCAIDPKRWPVALEAVRGELGGENASLDLVTLPHARSLLNVMTNIPAPFRDTMLDYSTETLELWGGLERLCQLPLEHPITLLNMRPDLPRLNDRPLVEWGRPQGLQDMIAVWLARDAEAMGFISFGRLERDGPFTAREVAIATLLIPHLQRAASINRLLDIAALERSTFATLFDALSVPVLLVGTGMRLIHANARARKMLGDGGALRERHGQLFARDIGTQHALGAAIAQLTGDRDRLDRQGIGIPLKLADGAVGALHVLPLARDAMPDRADALAAVFVAQSLNLLVAPTQIFAALFGLTPSEARVFDHIAAGRSVPQTADALGIEDSTVKTHLLRLYDKTGVRRQAELVHMAASLALPLVP